MLAPRARADQNLGEDETAAEGDSEDGAWIGPELLAPVDGGLDLLAQFLKVRAQIFATALNVLFYLIDCWAHFRFS
jgi:hypothetical protein